MKITLLSFGMLRDCTGARSCEWSLDDGVTVGELRTQLQAAFPSIPVGLKYAVAVKQHYAADEVILRDGDEVALIPPVSGG
ncbi:MAG: MoaD/ThiS family protein [Flavobacteriales bacterium]